MSDQVNPDRPQRRNGPDQSLSQPAAKKRKNVINILSLPEEALIKIASFLTQEDTLSLLYSNKAFERACKTRLYKKIIICEKYQDHYFFDMCNEKKITILSGWDNILNFFRMFHMKSFNDSPIDISKCVEDITSYNFLDRGRVDSYKVLSHSDLTTILNLRQFWNTVINGFDNLKVLVIPNLPLEKIFCLSPKLRYNLQKISICTEDDGALGSLDKYDIKLPSLKVLKLNFGKSLEKAKSAIDVVLKVITSDQMQNSTLEEIELNGLFGQADRHTEHTLRHLNFTNDINLTSVFVKGFNKGSKWEPYQFVSSISDNEAETDSENEIEGERDEAEDEIFRNAQEPHEMDGYDAAATDRESQIAYLLSEIEGSDVVFNGLSKTVSGLLYPILMHLRKKSVRFNNIKKLSLSNFEIPRERFEDEISIQLLVRTIFPNIENHVECLELRNIINTTFHDPYRNNVPYFQSDIPPSAINIFSDSPKQFPRLKKIFCCCGIDDSDIQDILEDVDRENKYNVCKLQLYELKNLLIKSPSVENIVVYASRHVHLRHFYRLISETPFRDNLKKLTFAKPDHFTQVARKILNARVFKKFNHFRNLKVLDDYYFGCSKKLVEHFIKTSRVNDFDDKDSISHTEDTEFFKEEFEYLFANDVKKFFRVCKNLQEFTYHGYTFERKNFLI